MNEQSITNFQAAVWDYYAHHGRHDMPWRQPSADGSFDPYKIMVSEVMLQQTQVGRVTPKYLRFLERFPSVNALAAASLGDVLREWNGLGYNRRAKFLWQAAQMVVVQFDGKFPADASELQKLPGIGANTAGAIVAYAYNQPALFLETNIRTVYIHHFFNDQTDVNDKSIAEVAAAALDREEPRQWYWALMDYGSYLKQTVGNLNKLSKSYAKQSAFHGSRRQIRGAVIRALSRQSLTMAQLTDAIGDERLASVLDDLVAEGLISKQTANYTLS